jgi:hypothetical protein
MQTFSDETESKPLDRAKPNFLVVPREPSTLTLPRKEGRGPEKTSVRLRLTPSPLAGEGRGGGSGTWQYPYRR